MKTIAKNIFAAAVALVTTSTVLLAQPAAQDVSQVMWKKQLVREIDLRNKPNQGMFASSNEISRYILEGLQSKQITAYQNDSLTNVMTDAALSKRLNQVITAPFFPCEDGDCEPEWREMNVPLLPKEIYLLRLTEDMWFDKQHSRMKYTPTAITLLYNDAKTGLIEPIATISYVDFEKYTQKRPDAIWYNAQNEGANLSITKAIELRLFHSTLVKVSNPQNETFVEQAPNAKAALWMQSQAGDKLTEFEIGLYEY